jgi:hypothetical protein
MEFELHLRDMESILVPTDVIHNHISVHFLTNANSPTVYKGMAMASFAPNILSGCYKARQIFKFFNEYIK